MKFACIHRYREAYPVAMMCRVLGVSRSGYYAWRDREPSVRAVATRKLVERIEAIETEVKGAYGSPRMTRELRAKGWEYGRHRVARVMARMGIQAKRTRAYKRTTERDERDRVEPNRMNRDFGTSRLNEKWAADVTYVPTQEGWVFLAVVLDLHSRRVVGWSMSDWLSQDLTLGALRMALGRCQPGVGLLHHSDRGGHYTGWRYRKMLRAAGIVCSMSRKGNCWDNAMVESFFSSLKLERVHLTRYRTRAEARADLFDYIEVFYNRRRLHSSLGYKSPTGFEDEIAA